MRCATVVDAARPARRTERAAITALRGRYPHTFPVHIPLMHSSPALHGTPAAFFGTQAPPWQKEVAGQSASVAQLQPLPGAGAQPFGQHTVWPLVPEQLVLPLGQEPHEPFAWLQVVPAGQQVSGPPGTRQSWAFGQQTPFAQPLFASQQLVAPPGETQVVVPGGQVPAQPMAGGAAQPFGQQI